jgi:hypothetical protein
MDKKYNLELTRDELAHLRKVLEDTDHEGYGSILDRVTELEEQDDAPPTATTAAGDSA